MAPMLLAFVAVALLATPPLTLGAAPCDDNDTGCLASVSGRRGLRQQPAPTQLSGLAKSVSDGAQLPTIAFDGFAFLTGTFGYDTFLPPGKVSDYFGFQSMRDVDVQGRGHSSGFLTSIAENMLSILSPGQTAQLAALINDKAADADRFANMRFPLIWAFRQNLAGQGPAGSTGLSRAAVKQLSSDLYLIDGQLAYVRAQVYASIVGSFSEQQKAALSLLKFGDSSTWPAVTVDRRSLSRLADYAALMGSASELFSWYAGSIEADVYFCPERHGMYFGGFGLKTLPAMGKQDYSIPLGYTNDYGKSFLALLTAAQKAAITGLVDLQRQDLAEIVTTRRSIATQLRQFLAGGAADQAAVLALSRRYGELDGDLSYLYATAFASVSQSLTPEQKLKMAALRPAADPTQSTGPFLYSTPISMPTIGSTDYLFA